MMQKLTIDPEFRDLIPPMSEEERKGLEENIKADGCHTAIFAWNDIIIDGHNRYEICTRNNIEFEVMDWDFADRRDARIWILRNQFDRRNLTPAQRMDLALLLKSDIQTRAQERKRATEGRPAKGTEKPVENFPQVSSDDRKTRTEVAKLAGVSGRTLDKYEKVKETAAPELVEALQKNAVSVDAAAKAAKILPKEEQAQIATSTQGKISKEINAAIRQREAEQKDIDNWNEFVDDAHAKMRSKDFDPAIERARVQTTRTLYDAIHTIAGMPTPAEVMAMIPDYAAHHLNDLSKAHAWLSDFLELYEGANHEHDLETVA